MRTMILGTLAAIGFAASVAGTPAPAAAQQAGFSFYPLLMVQYEPCPAGAHWQPGGYSWHHADWIPGQCVAD
jgi:hypothetical protein